jgi:hypothetical protein
MKHIFTDQTDVPPPAPVYDRRRTPDRRRFWRGGRRDSDWLDRPIGGLDRFEREMEKAERRAERRAKLSGWRRVLSTLHLW